MTILTAGRSMMLRQPGLLLSNDERVPSAEMPSGRLSMKKGMYQQPVIQVVQAPKAPPLKKKDTRKIRFHETVKVRSTLHVDDMTDDEFFNAWYSDDDMLNMKKNMAKDLKRFLSAKQSEKKRMQRKQKQLIMDMTTGIKNKSEVLNNQYADNYGLDSNKFTIRGLEHRTKKGSEIRRHTKFTALHAVLKEQEMQASCDSYDDEAIRSSYLQSGAKLSAMEANKVGIKDERDAKLIHEEGENQEAQGEEATSEEQTKQETKETTSANAGMVFNQLYIQTFHRKRKVLEELKKIISELEKQHEEMWLIEKCGNFSEKITPITIGKRRRSCQIF